MADNKKYYYMRLKENFFDSSEISLLESMPDGYLYSNILLKLYLRSLRGEGRLAINNIPYSPEMIATVTHHPVETVKKALDIFQKLGLIEILDSGVIYKKKDSQTGSAPQGNATLAGAVYQVSYQKGGQTVTEELTSDSSGNLGTLEGIPFGTVTVKELTAPEGYRLDTEVHTYTVDGSQLTGDVYELEVDDLTEDVMRGGLTIQKLDSQTGTTPQGDASLEGISFEIVNDSQNPVVVNGNTAAPGQVAMTITTNAVGVATTGENALPYGEYTVREVSTNDSMLQTFTEEISVTIDSDGEMLEYEAENEVIRGGIDLEKQDSEMGATPQGNSSFAGISFEIINRSANPVVVEGQTYAVGDVVKTITTDESGHASTGSDVLPYGTYEVRESATNESMLLTWEGEMVQVWQNGHSVSVTAVDEVERGGLSVEKQDSVTGSTPQGDANFEGINFQIINNSRNPVMVEGQKYQPGEVVKTLVTDSEGKASTADDLLPYGEYILHESSTNESMLLTAPDQVVLVEDDGVIYEFTMANEVVRGGVLIEKRDLESGLLTPLGGASLDGTLFEITNKSINAVFVGGALYQPGEVSPRHQSRSDFPLQRGRTLEARHERHGGGCGRPARPPGELGQWRQPIPLNRKRSLPGGAPAGGIPGHGHAVKKT